MKPKSPTHPTAKRAKAQMRLVIAAAIHASEHPVAWAKCSATVRSYYMARAIAVENRVARAILNIHPPAVAPSTANNKGRK